MGQCKIFPALLIKPKALNIEIIQIPQAVTISRQCQLLPRNKNHFIISISANNLFVVLIYWMKLWTLFPASLWAELYCTENLTFHEVIFIYIAYIRTFPTEFVKTTKWDVISKARPFSGNTYGWTKWGARTLIRYFCTKPTQASMRMSSRTTLCSPQG